jgi:magnesium transporter
VDVLAEEAEEDLSIIAGTRSEEPGERSTVKIFRERIPWLLTALFMGLISATILHHFEVALMKVIALAFFVPVITATGGNTAIQAASIVVRGLATGEIELRDLFPRILREIRISLLNGLALGIVLGSIVALWLSESGLGLFIGVVLLFIVCFASLLGAAVPIIMKRLGLDPALAMGPFVTTLMDILGLAIYLSMAMLFFVG